MKKSRNPLPKNVERQILDDKNLFFCESFKIGFLRDIARRPSLAELRHTAIFLP